MAARESRHQVRDIAVPMLREGRGEPLLFLHGAGGLPPWNAFFDKLAARYDVLVPEHPGFSTPDNATAIRGVADLAMYYLDFLDGLDTGPVHLMGQSLGGWVAAELAVRNCSRVKSLSLLAPAGLRVKGILSGDIFIWSPEETARNLFHDQSFAERRLAQPVSEEDADRALTGRFMVARLTWEPRLFSLALERWLHRVNVPTFVLWGENDKVLPAAYAARWRELVPHARVEVIGECGHLPHVEKAEVAAEKVLGFLAGNAGGRA
jgi:pimeloyl-ACP methyl ester carboxylesterase